MNNNPDLIFLDIMLPEMDGYEVLEVLNKSHLKDVPVIAISASAMPEQIIKGLKSGFHDYITKPINVSFFIHRFIK